MEWPASIACSDTADLRSQVYVVAIGSKRNEVELLKVVEWVEESSDWTNLKIIYQSRKFVLLLVSLRDGKAGRRGRQNARVWQTWLGHYLRVLSWSSLTINIFWSFTWRSVLRKVKLGGKLFQTKLLSRLSHKVCRLLSSAVLLRKFTIVYGVQ